MTGPKQKLERIEISVDPKSRADPVRLRSHRDDRRSPMIKVDIVNEVAKAADITRVWAVVAVEAILDALRTAMARGERIEIRGFGAFHVKPRKRGIGRNPRTGKEVEIPPGRTIRFRPGKALRNLSR